LAGLIFVCAYFGLLEQSPEESGMSSVDIEAARTPSVMSFDDVDIEAHSQIGMSEAMSFDEGFDEGFSPAF
jgi:hypothetical protein